MATAYLLCGLPGTGKTVFAQKLESQGCLRLTLDEEVLARTVEFRDPNNDLRVSRELLDHTSEEVEIVHKKLIVEALSNEKSVVVDHGFWSRKKRDEYKALIDSTEGNWRLFYFTVDSETQWERLDQRNQRDLVNTHYVSREEIELFATMFEPPVDEGAELA